LLNPTLETIIFKSLTTNGMSVCDETSKAAFSVISLLCGFFTISDRKVIVNVAARWLRITQDLRNLSITGRRWDTNCEEIIEGYPRSIEG